ncbi:unnamed protein product, partial [marine sediment metagenome]
EGVEYDPDNIMAAYVESLSESSLTAYAHAQDEVTCLDCHDITVLRQLYLQLDPDANELEGRNMSKLSKDLCLSCHESSELIELTKDSNLPEFKGINPHIHVADEDKLLRCSSCHKMHKEESININYCYSCHHAGVLVSCSECH